MTQDVLTETCDQNAHNYEPVARFGRQKYVMVELACNICPAKTVWFDFTRDPYFDTKWEQHLSRIGKILEQHTRIYGQE
jgi:hypothetical protein